MDEYEIGVCDSSQRQTHRFDAIGAASDHRGRVAENHFGLIGAIGGNRYYHLVDQARCSQAVDGSLQQTVTVNQKKRFGNTGAETLT